MAASEVNGLAAFTVSLLEHGGQFLLLQRAASKRVHPRRWTGLGGRVEPDEFADLHASALREVWEEAGLGAEAVEGFVLRRALLHAQNPGHLTLLLYFTGHLRLDILPPCPEGQLQWVAEETFGELDIIPSSRDVLPLLAGDHRRDPDGREGVRLGLFSDRETLWLTQ